ncbi:MAG: GYF domain-containing protein [Myxococcales bacterium]
MKIVCDSCSTKYSISDDKVRGKVFKIRCKKCSHIIVVKGATNEATPAAVEGPSDAVWHLVVDGDQVGPLTDSDVRARLARNEISAENYVWKEGFSDWLRLADVPEFADVASSISVPVSGELFSDSGREEAATVVADRETGRDAANDAGGDGFGGFFSGGAAGHASAEPAHAFADAGLAGAGGAVGEGGDLFGAVVPAARADSGRLHGRGANGAGGGGRHDGGRVENLTAQRSENSVLFSLSNLQSLASPAPAPSKPGTVQSTEGSGLIDIRAMAASTLRAPSAGGLPSFGGGRNDARSADDDLPAFGAFSSAAPVLLPIPSSSGPPKWLYALVAVAAVMIIAVGAAAFSILGKPVVVEQPAPAPVAVPEPAAKAKASPAGPKATEEAAAAGASKPIAAADLPPREKGDSAGGTAEKPAGDKVVVKGKGAWRGGKIRRGGGGPAAEGKAAGGGAVAASSGAAAGEQEKAKPAKGSLDDLLEGALNGRKGKAKVDDDGPGAGGGKKQAGESGAGAGPLAKGAVVAGMNGVKGKVGACYEKFKVPGMAMVNVVIGKNGRVSSTTVTGKFAGTPTGTCVENAVKTASFPPSEGLTTPYPFSLR